MAILIEWVDEEVFLLKAKGDSVVNAGINEGDLVLVRKTKDKPRNGQIVVAFTENGNTLKQFGYIENQPVLYAANKDYLKEKLTICPKTLEIQGIFTKIIKNVYYRKNINYKHPIVKCQKCRRPIIYSDNPKDKVILFVREPDAN